MQITTEYVTYVKFIYIMNIVLKDKVRSKRDAK